MKITMLSLRFRNIKKPTYLFIFVFLAAFTSMAAEPVRWQATKLDVRDKKYDVSLPRFSPDSRALAYAVSVPDGEGVLGEIRRYGFADRKTKTLLPLSVSREMAVYGAYPMTIEWPAPGTVKAELSNGDDGYNRYTLNAERGGVLSTEMFGIGDDEPSPKPEPALRALVSDWRQPVFDNALQYMIRIRAHGALMQKHYANEDDHLWWLDFGDRAARVALPEPADGKLEMMDGFAFGDYAVFALRQGTTVAVQRVDGDGRLQEIASSRVETPMSSDVIHSSVGEVDHRRCSATVCWGAYRVRRDDGMDARILRFDREGRVELLDPIPGLEDFDVSPDFKRMAAAVLRDGKRTILLMDIVAF